MPGSIETPTVHKVLVLSETQDLAKARTALTSPELQKADARGRRNRATKGSCHPVAAPRVTMGCLLLALSGHA